MFAAAFGVFVAADDLLVVSTMLRPIIGDLGLALPDDLDTAAWIVNVYLIAYLAVMPLAGRLSDVFGRRRVYDVSLLVFALGSIVVPLASSLPVFLVGRALTAIGGGALVPIALGIASDSFRDGARSRAFGLLGAIETMGWIWGPIYGALLVRYLTWEWQFYLNLPLAAVGVVLAQRFLPQQTSAAEKIDLLGAGFLTLGLTAASVALLGQARIQSAGGLDELAGRESASIPLGLVLPLALVGVVGFVWRQRTAAIPLLDLSFGGAHRRSGPAAALAVNVAFGACLITALVNVPLLINVLESDTGTAALRSGWALTALTAALGLTSYVGGALAAHFEARVPTILGMTIAAGGLAMLGAIWEPDTSLVTISSVLVVVGAGLGLAMTPTTTALTGAAGDRNTGTAAGLVLVFRMIGFSLGLAGLTTYGLRRFSELRGSIELPLLSDPGYTEAATDAVRVITSQALAETFLAAGVVAAVSLVAAGLLPGRHSKADERVGRQGPTE